MDAVVLPMLEEGRGRATDQLLRALERLLIILPYTQGKAPKVEKIRVSGQEKTSCVLLPPPFPNMHLTAFSPAAATSPTSSLSPDSWATLRTGACWTRGYREEVLTGTAGAGSTRPRWRLRGLGRERGVTECGGPLYSGRRGVYARSGERVVFLFSRGIVCCLSCDRCSPRPALSRQPEWKGDHHNRFRSLLLLNTAPSCS